MQARAVQVQQRKQGVQRNQAAAQQALIDAAKEKAQLIVNSKTQM